MTAAEKYDIKTAPVSEAEINFLAEIFREILTAEVFRRKEDNNAPDHKEI